ncbi:MAG TPA: DUF2182 domain-containing protein [Rubrivivax sp.]|nr:DUF2182 domain-containing protein [Rubrivivax sp.]
MRPSWMSAALLLALAGWAALAWLATHMDSELASWTMPGDADWQAGQALAVLLMWGVMMAAMMLPSALPMLRAFVDLSRRRGERARPLAFVAAYLAVWLAFSAAATGAQWALQAAGWIDPMARSTSAPLTAALLLIAGAYQFSPLKRLCLAGCRTPLGFLVGEWRGGVRGAVRMGLRHGVMCLGCCAPLMALLFVGGVMNLAWVAALAIAAAIEKMAPQGERLARWLGLALLAAGAWQLLRLG